MAMQEIMSAPPVVASARTPVEAVARLMAEAGVGAVVVVDDHRVLGIVTDRDIAVRTVAAHRSPQDRVEEVMSTEVVTVPVDATVDEAYEALRRVPFRRLPVLDATGAVCGMVTADDLLLSISRRVADLARPVAGELLEARGTAAVPAAR